MAKFEKNQIQPRCRLCRKAPGEIDEYVFRAKDESNYFKDADDVVRQDEGTYNPETGQFYCTDCYVKAGMPRGTA
jgi:hypothetical protein